MARGLTHWVVETPKPARAFLKTLGLRFPMIVKRGYHLHYKPPANVSLTRPVVDLENGFVLTPMEKGIRLTTGIEFRDRDAPPPSP